MVVQVGHKAVHMEPEVVAVHQPLEQTVAEQKAEMAEMERHQPFLERP